MSEAVRLMSRSLAVRARVRPRPEPPLDRFHDPLIDDLTAAGPLSRERFATAWSDTDALRRLAESKRAPLPPALAAAMVEQHRRLGASPESLRGLERLARGEAVCAVAGQQPAPLGGPLYSLHKTAATVGLASSIEARTGIRCVPMFWMHGEDSDFNEIRGATLADASLALHDLALPESAHREGELVGNVALDSLATLDHEAVLLWSGLDGAKEVAALLASARGPARDLGEASAALMLRLFESAGLVVVDPRLPAFREAARPILDRYLANAEELSAQARRAGALLQQRIGRQPLSEASLDSFVFAVDDGVRRKLSPDEARKRDRSLPLSPSVALRPAVQDGVFPTVAMACGPGEIAYLAAACDSAARSSMVPRLAPSPRVRSTSPTRCPCAASSAASPPEVSSMSSGWAPKNRASSALTGPPPGVRSTSRRGAPRVRWQARTGLRLTRARASPPARAKPDGAPGSSRRA